MKQKREVKAAETPRRALAREAVALTNSGKHGPLFGEVSVVTGFEIVDNWIARLLARVLAGDRVWIAGLGTFFMRRHPGNAKRPEGWSTLAFSAATPHRGLPKKGGAP